MRLVLVLAYDVGVFSLAYCVLSFYISTMSYLLGVFVLYVSDYIGITKRL